MRFLPVHLCYQVFNLLSAHAYHGIYIHCIRALVSLVIQTDPTLKVFGDSPTQDARFASPKPNGYECLCANAPNVLDCALI